MSRTFLIAGEVVAEDAAAFSERLADAHARRERPLCLCLTDGLPMYVARVGDRLLLKRMPMTGQSHDPDCSSYEPPPELSGRGEVEGRAIEEDAAEGVIRLKLGFSLSKRGSRAAATTTREIDETARTDGGKLTLRGLLHYLWEEAELNHWSPGMLGRRNWAVVRHRLVEATAGMVVKGAALGTHLLMPETFATERKAEIAERRAATLKALVRSDGRVRPLMLLIGEVKEIAPARVSHRLMVKHLPDMPFMLAEDVYRQLAKRFAIDLELADGVPGARLIAVATFGRSAAGVASIEQIALLAVTEQWLPIENAYDAALVAELARSGQRFVKGLRYNLSRRVPLACAVLPGTRPKPTALFVVPPGADESYRDELDALIAGSQLSAWVWQAEAAMPSLPT